MATLYSTAYSATTARTFSSGAETTSTTYSYKLAWPKQVGDVQTVTATYNLANGALSSTNTSLVVCDLPANCKPLLLTISSGDDDIDSDNDLTVNIGYTGALTAIASADTGLQAGGELNYTAAQLNEIFDEVTTVGTEQLIIGRQAGASNSSGTIYVQFVYTIA